MTVTGLGRRSTPRVLRKELGVKQAGAVPEAERVWAEREEHRGVVAARLRARRASAADWIAKVERL